MSAPPGSIRFLRDRLLGFSPDNLLKLITVSINNTAYKAIPLNQSQIYGGFDAEGDEINPGYALFTYALTKFTNNALPQFTKAEFGVPDLYLTGAFYGAFTAKEDPPGFLLLDSLDAKSPELKRKYGSAIFGLNEKNATLYIREDFFPEFADGFTGATGLIFQ